MESSHHYQHSSNLCSFNVKQAGRCQDISVKTTNVKVFVALEQGIIKRTHPLGAVSVCTVTPVTSHLMLEQPTEQTTWHCHP